jgi:hypothetical protein
LTSDTIVLREIGGTSRSFFGLMDGPKLTLIDSKTLAPYYELMDTQTTDLAEGYRHYKGNGPNRDVIEAAVEMKGNDIIGMKSRLGTPCPNNANCIAQNQVPLLPGEKVSQTRNVVGNVGKAATSVRNGLIRLGGGGKAAQNTNKTAVGAEVAADALDSNNPLLKFQWRSFELTSNLPKRQ